MIVDESSRCSTERHATYLKPYCVPSIQYRGLENWHCAKLRESSIRLTLSIVSRVLCDTECGGSGQSREPMCTLYRKLSQHRLGHQRCAAFESCCAVSLVPNWPRNESECLVPIIFETLTISPCCLSTFCQRQLPSAQAQPAEKQTFGVRWLSCGWLGIGLFHQTSTTTRSDRARDAKVSQLVH